jgi:hypothetical protein
MYYSQFADGVRYYKESEGCKEKFVKNMNLTINQAFDVLDVSETDRKAIADLI